jgi:hypothetical protein
MARLVRARLGLIIALAACAPIAAPAAEQQWCAVDARVNRGGTGRASGDVTVPLAAKLEPTAVGKIAGYITIVFPQSERGWRPGHGGIAIGGAAHGLQAATGGACWRGWRATAVPVSRARRAPPLTLHAKVV